MIALTLALAPRVMQDSPVGRLKKRLLAACRKRFDSGFESLLCPFLYRLSFDLVPDRSFPDLTISGVKKIITLAQLLVVQVQMTLSLYWWRQRCIHASALFFDRRWRCFTSIMRTETSNVHLFRSCFIRFKWLFFKYSFTMYALSYTSPHMINGQLNNFIILSLSF